MKRQSLNVEVQFLKEGDLFVAFSHALDLSTCGESFEEAQVNFEEAAKILLEECDSDNTLNDLLDSLGWIKTIVPAGDNASPSEWLPPPIVGRVDLPISVPV